jgi:glycosyltransferase involved in cell wall biosynthesis
VERHCEELYRRLAARGVPVLVCTRSPYRKAWPKWAEWEGVRLRRVWAPRNKYLEALCHSLASVFVARAAGCRVLHVHAIGPGLVVPLARLLGFRVVFTHHGFDYRRQKWGRVARAMLQLGEWCAVRWAHETLAVSEEIAAGVQARFGRVARMAPNGVEVAARDVQAGRRLLESAGATPGEYAIAVARLVPEKGWDVLFRAIAQLDWRPLLLGIGGADHRSRYAEALLRTHPANVRMLGECAHDITLHLVSRSRVFVLPSYHEGLPIVLLEAMALGSVVVASDIPPNREVVRNGQNGFLFPTGDDRMLATVLAQAWSLGSEERARLVAQARKTVSDGFRWERAVTATLEAYRAVGGGGCTPPAAATFGSSVKA